MNHSDIGESLRSLSFCILQERRALLDNYIRKFIEVDGVKNSNEFHTFLTKDRTDVIPAKKAPREYNAEEYPEDQEV